MQREPGVQIRLCSEHAPILEIWAMLENRPVEDVLNELIANAIQQRSEAEAMIERGAQLTRRERAVMALFSIDKSRGEIAEILTVEHRALKAHLRNAVKHLDWRVDPGNAPPAVARGFWRVGWEQYPYAQLILG